MSLASKTFSIFGIFGLAFACTACVVDTEVATADEETQSSDEQLIVKETCLAPTNYGECGDGVCDCTEVGVCVADCSPPYTPPTVHWSAWLDRDDPADTGDWEQRSDFTVSQVGCSSPTYIEAQTLNGTSWQYTGEKLTVSPSGGLVCRNVDQPDRICFDYRVRFGCVY